MPPKTIASILNNESNLRILEKLKKRPYYPRELAMEMKLSEPFIVRRLKAMEEAGIVEGRWETEGGRKVKRYHVLDIQMRLGKDGLTMTSAEAVHDSEIDLKKESVRVALYLPVILAVIYIMNSQNVALIAATCLYWLWLICINAAFYRNNMYKSTVTASIILTLGLMFLSALLAVQLVPVEVITGYVTPIRLFIIATAFFIFIVLIYHIRFSIAEEKDVVADKKSLVLSLGTASLPMKFFYLPLALKWKIGEYFSLH